MNNGLFKRCHINSNYDGDKFVGIKKDENLYQISFLLGFRLSENEKEVRRDIILLMNILAKFMNSKEYEFYNGNNIKRYTDLPIQAYLYVIKDYFERGIYEEREVYYHVANRGKIDWKKTIKVQRPVIQDGDIFYLDYIVKKNTINENELITIVHQYCVNESFEKFGWLFTSYVPPKPKIGLTRKMMLSIVNNKLQDTFNDRNRQLFKNLLSILRVDDNNTNCEFNYGTYNFEYIWEKMIDNVFGISGKEEYFPKTTWYLLNNKDFDNSVLQPDTIMIYQDKIYVLDAKYYKYGETANPYDLPKSSSINKQITYGEYIAKGKKFEIDGKKPIVYNAFIIPYNAYANKFYTCDNMSVIGIAKSSWKYGKKEYENIVGILLDVKHLMKINERLNFNEIKNLAKLIEQTIERYKV